MEDTDDSGWNASADAWIASIGETGDWARRFVLDKVMLERIDGRHIQRALDVGCGEGRFCRILGERRIPVTGIDPTRVLLDRAKSLDPDGDYQLARAEKLPFEDDQFDLVVSYLTLVDIDGYEQAIREMARVLIPGGTVLVANLSAMGTAGSSKGWITAPDGELQHWPVDHYLSEYPMRSEWSGISIINWHRPLSAYMKAFLAAGLQLAHFDEPAPHSGDPARIERYRRMPWFVVLEWTVPA